MVSNKTIYRLLSAIDQFRSEAKGDDKYADEVEQLGQIESDLKKESKGETPDDDKGDTPGKSFDDAAQKTKENFTKKSGDSSSEQ